LGYSERMSPRRHRADLIPNANNPRLLQRLVRLVASGIRKQRALADVLQVEVRTVHYYTQAGEWLGLLDTDREVHLTPRGVEFAFAESRQRAKLYAKAVWGVPFVQALLAQRGDMPGTEVIASFILENEPTMSPRTARRRATSLKGVIEPALSHRPTRSEPQGKQLAFSFANPENQPKTAQTRASKLTSVDLRAGTENNPDIYGRLLTSLLDHGEITTGQIRALLDGMGARDSPLGGYVEMAIRRADATRHADRLIVTAGAASRREFAGDGVLVALTDPSYRAYLLTLAEAENTPATLRERAALSTQFAAWDRRVFGDVLTEETVHSAITKPLVGRSISSLPIASNPGPATASTSAPFLDTIDVSGMMVAFPSSLKSLNGGVSWVNEALTRNRNAPAGVRPPNPVCTRASVHGGLLCPSETLPRTIPDTLTLRLRLLTHCPAFSLLSCLLLLDRKEDTSMKLVEHESEYVLYWGKKKIDDILSVFDRFCSSQDWVVSRPLSGGLTGRNLIETGIVVGMCARVNRRIVLDEHLFLRLQEDAEARMVYEALLPLEDRLHAWLNSAGK
jgi:hypothetical protein